MFPVSIVGMGSSTRRTPELRGPQGRDFNLCFFWGNRLVRGLDFPANREP
jgi:hypothetical protein